MERHDLGWFLIAVGTILLIAGGLLVMLPTLGWLGRLPGDIRIERDNFHFYFPITTSILLSLLLTIVFSVIRLLGTPR